MQAVRLRVVEPATRQGCMFVTPGERSDPGQNGSPSPTEPGTGSMFDPLRGRSGWGGHPSPGRFAHPGLRTFNPSGLFAILVLHF